MARKSNGTYEIDLGLSKTQRAAHFLDWYSKHHPGAYVAFNELLRSIMGYSKKPLLHSEETEHMRKSMSGIKKVLFEKFNREVISLPGVGIRASIDDADKLKNVVPKKAGRLHSARNSFVNTVSTLDQKSIPNTPELVPYKNWLNREIKDLMKQISSTEFERKLLPPSTAKTEKVEVSIDDEVREEKLAKTA